MPVCRSSGSSVRPTLPRSRPTRTASDTLPSTVGSPIVISSSSGCRRGGASPGPRLDFYNYWMKMHSWMSPPSGSTAYYGNSLVHQKGFTAANDNWICLEIMVKVNPSPASGAGAELAVWKNDTLVQHFTDKAPLGYWIKDKFCPKGADNPTCTSYPPPPGTKLIPLDLQLRSTTTLKLNYVWPQNYITAGAAGDVTYDDIVIAKARVGCLH